MDLNPQILDEPSENLMFWDEEGFPQTIASAFEFEGPLVDAALRSSVAWAVSSRPRFAARLHQIRVGRQWIPAWHFNGAAPAVESGDLRLDDVPESLHRDRIEAHLASLVGRTDLSREAPARVQCVRLTHRRWALIVAFHHVLMDAAGLYAFVRDVLSDYHLRVTGSPATWAAAPSIHAAGGSVSAPVSLSAGRMVLRMLAENREYPIRRCAQIAGTASGVPGRAMIRRDLTDPLLLDAMKVRARRAGGTLTDLFLAGSKVALAEWNRERDTPHDIFHHGLAVNLRNRVDPAHIREQGNPMTGFTVCTRADERRDPDTTLRLVIDRRRAKSGQGVDMGMADLTRTFVRRARSLPPAWRYRLLHGLVDIPISFFLTNVGVLWPRFHNGRPTGETALREAGGAFLLDVHLSVGATRSNPLALILQGLNDRLQIIYIVGTHRLTRREGESFADLMIRRTVEMI